MNSRFLASVYTFENVLASAMGRAGEKRDWHQYALFKIPASRILDSRDYEAWGIGDDRYGYGVSVFAIDGKQLKQHVFPYILAGFGYFGDFNSAYELYASRVHITEVPM